jgi:hypothetical protein
MLSEVSKSRIRMHLGVPAAGLPQTGSQLGWRYNNQVGALEYRMINLQPIEEAQLTGYPAALIQIAGQPQQGDTVTVTIGSGSPIIYTVTSADVAAAIPLQSISQNLAKAITLANQGYLGDYGIPPQTKPTQTFGSYQGIVLIQPVPPANAAFSIAVVGTGNTLPYVAQQGVQTPPSVAFAETGITVYGYVAICDYLESRIANSADLVKYATATGAGGAGINLRMNELAERRNIYDEWCDKLADFFGIQRFPMGRPAAAGSAAFTGSIG